MTVVHCKAQSFTHYIGRPSPFGNPYSHRPSSFKTLHVPTREDAIAHFEADVWKHKHMQDLIFALPEDAVLGCWCAPNRCHGEAIIRIWKKLHGKESAA